MEPNNNTPDQPVVPSTPDPASQQEVPGSVQPTSTAPDLTDESAGQAPVSPLQAITGSGDTNGNSAASTEVQPTTSEELTTSAQPAAMPPAASEKKSKTTMYLIIALVVLALGAAGLYIYTLQ